MDHEPERPTVAANAPAFDEEPLDDEPDSDPIIRRSVQALGQPLPLVACPRSVFDIATAPTPRHGLACGSLQTVARPTATAVNECIRSPGVTRCTGVRYPADRWTEERAEHERQRRARQKPPKPVKRARTRGKKVRAWDGEGIE